MMPPVPGAAADAYLSVIGFAKHYAKLVALDGVSFTIRRGEILGLIGPNGAGKTTLFECLAGVLPPTAGAIHAGGRPLADAERAARLFYLPDGIAPWPAQPVGWALDFAVGYFGGQESRRAEVVAGLGLEPL